MDENHRHARSEDAPGVEPEPALAQTGELMLLKHNYLDGWLQTYIVDLQERQLSEFADMYASLFVLHDCSMATLPHAV